MYATGEGVPQDLNKALKLTKSAAKKHDPAAQALLGTLYAGGLGVSSDSAEAVVWRRKAGEAGNASAQYGL
jgi:TPR repeat protein